MPSPIAHITAGYLIYHLFRARLLTICGKCRAKLLLALTLSVSLMPDIDLVVGVLLRDLGRYHNNLTHSLLVGFSISAGAWLAARLTGQRNPFMWSLIVLLCYDMHVIMDFFTVGRGVMLLWPLTRMRYEAPIKLFYGLHWSDGLFSTRHLWTLLTEGILVLPAALLLLLGRNRETAG